MDDQRSKRYDAEFAAEWEAQMTAAIDVVEDLVPNEWDALTALDKHARDALIVLARLSEAQRAALRSLLLLGHATEDRRVVALGIIDRLAWLGFVDKLTKEEADLRDRLSRR